MSKPAPAMTKRLTDEDRIKARQEMLAEAVQVHAAAVTVAKQQKAKVEQMDADREQRVINTTSSLQQLDGKREEIDREVAKGLLSKQEKAEELRKLLDTETKLRDADQKDFAVYKAEREAATEQLKILAMDVDKAAARIERQVEALRELGVANPLIGGA